MLHVEFALLGREHVLASPGIDEWFQAVSPCEAGSDRSAMFPASPPEIGGDADVKRAIAPIIISDHVQPTAHCDRCG